MIPVYQDIIDPGHGNCMQAALASLLELPIDKVPHFLELQNENNTSAYHYLCQFILDIGLDYSGTLHNHPSTDEKYKDDPKIRSILRLKEYEGYKGYFYASVFSPKYYDYSKRMTDLQVTHAVICDKDYNIVFDPNPANKDVKKYPMADELGFNGIMNILLISEKLKNL